MALQKHIEMAGKPMNKNGVNSDLRITNCTICRLGIFQGQPKVWICNGYIGFVHKGCLNGKRPTK